MLEQILDIKEWDTNPGQVNSHTATEVFISCIAGAEQIVALKKQLNENPSEVIQDLISVLNKKLIEINILQLEADETMNQKFLIKQKRKQHESKT